MTAPDRARFAAEARAHVAAHFSLAVMQGETLVVYDRLLGTKLAENLRKA